ncbi:sensor histidine kinase [Luteibacter aegosomatissinici]|uniref:sensor histidine kinase n=1 Tax=Luteibacter aegosomatissinici TaxID=2911539 RepID=UPI001FFA3171|nr:histidine kinase [Luteibacter aegosomatissinici]UPG94159.1 histidine kinase [Luteibacter aegosomatissinici]
MRVDRSVTLSPAMAWVAGLPILGCMMVMSLPALADERVLAFRLFYALAYLFWIVPLGWLQRWLWRRGAGWWAMAGVLLPVTYAMSVGNALLALNFIASEKMRAQAGAAWIFGGLDGCWLALIAFCGFQAIVLHRAALALEGERLHQAAQAARDAELRALRYQLQPHFLFNTLNAISALVRDERPRDATRMIARLGDFLRTTLEEIPGHEHAVADEIALTAAYLDIEKARLGERLHIETYTAPGTLEARVPYLLMQPLVENAVRHGIAPRTAPGTIVIRVEGDGDELRVTVINDVVEVTEGAVGVGLANVRARLEALYPGSHRVVAGPENGRWRVHIRLPWAVAGSGMEAAT